MYRDDIIAEVWENRDAYAAEHHNNLGELVKDHMQRRDQRHGTIIDRRPSKALGQTRQNLDGQRLR